MTKVSSARLNKLFPFSELRANLLLVSWLLMNMSFQKHNQLTFTSGLSFPSGPTLKPAEQDSGSFSVTEIILHTRFP